MKTKNLLSCTWLVLCSMYIDCPGEAGQSIYRPQETSRVLRPRARPVKKLLRERETCSTLLGETSCLSRFHLKDRLSAQNLFAFLTT